MDIMTSLWWQQRANRVYISGYTVWKTHLTSLIISAKFRLNLRRCLALLCKGQYKGISLVWLWCGRFHREILCATWILMFQTTLILTLYMINCCLNKPLSEQSWGWWFQTPSRSLWRHCYDFATEMTRVVAILTIRRQGPFISYNQ